MRRWMLSVLSVILCLAWLLPTSPGQVAKTDERKPDFSVTAENLSREFNTNFAEAKKKYKDKAVEITGEVAFIMTFQEGKLINVFLRGAKQSPKDNDTEYLTIALLPEYNRTGALLSKNQKIKVVGIPNDAGHSLLYGFLKCSLTEITKSEVIAVSAEELAKAFSKDAKEAAQKYDEKEILLSGTVDAITKDQYYPSEIKGDGKTRIATTSRELKVGQVVRLRGKCSWGEKDLRATLSETQIIELK